MSLLPLLVQFSPSAKETQPTGQHTGEANEESAEGTKAHALK